MLAAFFLVAATFSLQSCALKSSQSALEDDDRVTVTDDSYIAPVSRKERTPETGSRALSNLHDTGSHNYQQHPLPRFDDTAIGLNKFMETIAHDTNAANANVLLDRNGRPESIGEHITPLRLGPVSSVALSPPPSSNQTVNKSTKTTVVLTIPVTNPVQPKISPFDEIKNPH